MQYAIGNGGIIAVRLTAGEQVHESLLEACARCGTSAAFVLSGIGMLKDPKLGWFDTEHKQYHDRDFPGRHELLVLAGNISEKDGAPFAHLHATLSDEEYHCFGGHLFSAEVGLTLEVALLPCGEGVSMRREMEAAWGIPGLVVEQK